MTRASLCLLFALMLAGGGGEARTWPRRVEREAMVREQIVRRGVRDEIVVAAMNAVPRHRFVPPRQQGRAYEDTPLPIGHGQTISQPYMVAYMTEILGLAPGEKVLEIGTGSGYQAAVLARCGVRVWSVEIIPALGERAALLLKELGFMVQTMVGDGYHGWSDYAPYDAMIVTAAAEFIPPPLINQLKSGGRMVIPVGPPFGVQTLMLVEKEGEKLRTRSLMPVRFVPLTRRQR